MTFEDFNEDRRLKSRDANSDRPFVERWWPHDGSPASASEGFTRKKKLINMPTKGGSKGMHPMSLQKRSRPNRTLEVHRVLFRLAEVDDDEDSYNNERDRNNTRENTHSLLTFTADVHV